MSSLSIKLHTLSSFFELSIPIIRSLQAIGCIITQMMTGVPIFHKPMASYEQQLEVILSTLGTPSEEEWQVFLIL